MLYRNVLRPSALELQEVARTKLILGSAFELLLQGRHPNPICQLCPRVLCWDLLWPFQGAPSAAAHSKNSRKSSSGDCCQKVIQSFRLTNYLRKSPQKNVGLLKNVSALILNIKKITIALCIVSLAYTDMWVWIHSLICSPSCLETASPLLEAGNSTVFSRVFLHSLTQCVFIQRPL